MNIARASAAVGLTGLAAGALLTSLSSFSSGVIGPQVGFPTIARTQGCGICHSGNQPGANNLVVTLDATDQALDLGESITVTLAAPSGGAAPFTNGGFAAEATSGAFAAGANTQIDNTGAFITHTNPNQRTWSFGYTAPQTPGPVQIFAVVNTVNGNFGTRGDIWRFPGFDPLDPKSTPLNLYVNPVGATGFGQGCDGAFGLRPVIGAQSTPTVGNANFAIELVGAATQVPVTLIAGTIRQTPLDLTSFGAAGCSLLIDPISDVAATTSGPAGSTVGEGAAVLSVPIPNVAGVQGVQVAFQAVLLDQPAGRALPVTLTHGLDVTVQ